MHIFISYSKKDIEFARHVRALLKAENFPVWMDEEGISGGDQWEKTIETNLSGAAAFLIIMSPSSRESDWVRRELLLAEKLKKPIFPVLLAGDVWWNLADIQYEQMQSGMQATFTPKFVGRLRGIMPAVGAQQTITLKIVAGNITEIDADVIALKYAQYFLGADLAVATLLTPPNTSYSDAIQPPPGKHALVETFGATGASHTLFMGVNRLADITYADIQSMSAEICHILKTELPVEHLAMTIHGTGFGLDETAALIAQINGYLSAFHANDLPSTLRRITIVELIPETVKRLRVAFEAQFGGVFERVPGDEWAYAYTLGANAAAPVAPISQEQPYAFVIMATDPELDDFFYYGIQNAVHSIGDLCTRMELSLHDAEIMGQIRQKIDGAHLVITDLTGLPSAALLYLGYAWGKQRPTILIKQTDTVTELTEHGALTYERIRDLEQGLRRKIGELKASGQLS